MKIHIIDLNFFKPKAIASFLIETDSEPVLIETGPDSSFPNLEASLKNLGYSVGDIKKVFLTHIHLDHAGAAWHFAETDNFGLGQIGDVAFAIERQHVMFAQAVDFNVFNDHHLIILGCKDGSVDDLVHVEMISARQKSQARIHALRCASQAFTGRILSQLHQDVLNHACNLF